LNDYINEAYLYYWQWLVKAKHPDTLLSVLIDIPADDTGIPLPDDYMQARLVERVLPTQRVPLQWFERFEESVYTSGVPSDNTGYIPRYRIERDRLFLEPVPNSAITQGIKLTYYFHPAELVNDTDEPDIAFKSIYHDLLVYQATTIAKSKEEGIGGGGVDLGPWGILMKKKELAFQETISPPSVQRLYVTAFVGGSDGEYS
jgi:hypothetical protein